MACHTKIWYKPRAISFGLALTPLIWAGCKADVDASSTTVERAPPEVGGAAPDRWAVNAPNSAWIERVEGGRDVNGTGSKCE
jgi:hypothetical protein